MTKIRLNIARCLTMLMLLSIALPALALGPADCCQPPPVAEVACCEAESPEPEVCEPACYIVCERPPGVDPFQGIDWHHFQPVLLFANLPQPTPPIVAVWRRSVADHIEKNLPRAFELPPVAHPNPPPQLL